MYSVFREIHHQRFTRENASFFLSFLRCFTYLRLSLHEDVPRVLIIPTFFAFPPRRRLRASFVKAVLGSLESMLFNSECNLPSRLFEIATDSTC